MAQRLWPQLYKYQPTEKLVICCTVVLKKGVTLIFILTNPFQCYLSLSVWFVCVCVCVCVLFIYTISISVNCVSLEELSLIASNQQIYDFYKLAIFEKKIHCRE